MRRIQVFVQVDRLPNVTDSAGVACIQIGLRVSAAIQPERNGAVLVDGAQAGDDDRILPWRWKATAGGAAWDPHTGAAWRVFFRDNTGAFVEIKNDLHYLTREEAEIEDGAGVRLFDPAKRFATRLDEEVEAIKTVAGIRGAAEALPAEGVVRSRTLMGLMESLSSLPNPIPAATKVWTAARVPVANLANFDNDRGVFIAIPRFATATAQYEPRDTFTASGERWQGAFDPPTMGELEAWALIASSLPLVVLTPSPPERLIDLEQLKIRAKQGEEFEVTDWTATAGLRLAEAIDPAAQAMAVLDAALQNVIVANPDRPTAEALRAHLIEDLRHQDLFRAALTELHRPVVARRITCSPIAPAPAISFLGAAAARDSNAWPAVAPLLFGQATQRHDDPATFAVEDLATAPPYRATSRERILGAAGIAPSPNNEPEPGYPAGNYAVAERERRVLRLDDERSFVDWIIDHWLHRPGTSVIEANQPRTISGLQREWKKGATATLAVRDTGAIDFSRARLSEKPFEVTLRLTPVKVPIFPLTIKVRFETVDRRLEWGYDVDAMFTDISSTGNGGTHSFEQGFPITLRATGNGTGLEIIANGTAPVDVSPLLQGGPMRVVLQGDQSFAYDIAAPLVLPTVDRDRLRGQAVALRSALSWAWGSELVTALLQGWLPIAGAVVVPPSDPNEAFAARLTRVAGDFVDQTFPAAFTKAADEAGIPNGDKLRDLLTAVCNDAQANAKHALGAVVPPALEPGANERITADALPLAFLISQLQDFDDQNDLWARLAGVGVLLSREPELSQNKWWSLNVATLHAPDSSETRDLGKDNFVATGAMGGGEEPWKLASRIDAVPLVIGESGGVRSTLLKYENHSVVGEEEGSSRPGDFMTRSAGRRPEAYFSPTKNFVPRPAITFGRTYGVMPYLIGQGGVVPLALRKDAWNPVRLKKSDAEGKRQIDFGNPGGAYVYSRTAKYLRTVPVSAPRLSSAEWPAPIPGVAALADELPVRLTPVTLHDSAKARFFVDHERLGGLMSARGDAVRLELRAVYSQASNAIFTVKVQSRVQGVAADALNVTLDLERIRATAGTATFGIRIELGTDLKIFALIDAQDPEDEPAAEELDGTHFTVVTNAGIAAWKAVYVALELSVGAVNVEPPTLRWASMERGVLKLDGDRPILPPELAHASRKIAVLDGIAVGAKTGLTKLDIKLRRPSTTLSTYERWINGPTGGYGSATKEEIYKRLEAARTLSRQQKHSDRSIDDPAVESIFLEVVEVFPLRRSKTLTYKWGGGSHNVAGPALARRLAHSLDPVTNLDTKEQLAIACQVVATPPVTFGNVDVDTGKVTLRLEAGSIYEIRTWGAVPEKQLFLAPDKTNERFSAAVRASWLHVKDAHNEEWQLGTPLALTIEVATERMPECWKKQPNAMIDYENPIFVIETHRPPLVIEDRAIVRFVPENAGDPKDISTPWARRASLRYVHRAALLTQRWSWRGRPHPHFKVDRDPCWGTVKRQATDAKPLISPDLGMFVSAAFLGRADDEIGPVREVILHRAHVTAKKGNRPVLLEHDLHRRAGVHLWRFALRLTSRYAAMRPNHPEMLRFSHQPIGSADPKSPVPSGTKWWRVVVPDHTGGGGAPRRIDRPSLMLVLPLTEPLMAEGSVPPLLAVFNQELFNNFNAADGIETVIDVARHPFPLKARIDEHTHTDGSQPNTPLEKAWAAVQEQHDALIRADRLVAESHALQSRHTDEERYDSLQHRDAERKRLQDSEVKLRQLVPAQLQPVSADLPNPTLKYYQEIAPDPIREATANPTCIVAVRTDGPIGYTFDAGTEAGLFKHAAVLVSPIAEQVRAYSLVKLRFRRLETSGLLVGGTEEMALILRQTIDEQGSRFLIERSTAGTIDTEPNVVTFDTVYEGLTFEFEPSAERSNHAMHIRFAPHKDENEGTTIRVSFGSEANGRLLRITAQTRLGPASDWSLPLRGDPVPKVQAVVSMRPRPTNEEGTPVPSFQPVGDISIRVRIDRELEEGIRRPDENVWLSVLCMPLTTLNTFTDRVAVEVRAVSDDGPAESIGCVVTPTRLSDFAPAVWCQFAAPMSRLEVTAATAERKIFGLISVDDLTFQTKADSSVFTLSLRGLRPGETLSEIALRVPSHPDETSQLEETLFAVVTQYVHDAFDRLRERVMAIHSVDAKPEECALGARVWPEALEAPASATSGRIRFLRVLRGKSKGRGGFEGKTQIFPGDFFQDRIDDAVDANPSDAAGMVMGVSAPVEWNS